MNPKNQTTNILKNSTEAEPKMIKYLIGSKNLISEEPDSNPTQTKYSRYPKMLKTPKISKIKWIQNCVSGLIILTNFRN